MAPQRCSVNAACSSWSPSPGRSSSPYAELTGGGPRTVGVLLAALPTGVLLGSVLFARWISTHEGCGSRPSCDLRRHSVRCLHRDALGTTHRDPVGGQRVLHGLPGPGHRRVCARDAGQRSGPRHQRCVGRVAGRARNRARDWRDRRRTHVPVNRDCWSRTCRHRACGDTHLGSSAKR
jgi:hypothetical protein